MSSDNSTDTAPFPLAMAQAGERVKIFLLRGGKSVEMRLIALGLNVGGEWVVSQREGNTLVVRRGETRLALGADMAHRIMVVRS